MTPVQLFNALNSIVFLVALVISLFETIRRVILYRIQGYPRPRLLTRDVIVIGGFAWTASLLLIARAFGALGADISGLSSNILWVSATGIPATVAVVTYAYFEIFVIERGRKK